MNFLLYFILGVIEQFFAILYYKTASKNYDFLCALIDLIRGSIWLFVIASLIENVGQNVWFGVAYVIGGSCGDYLSLKAETKIEKMIFNIRRKGRRKKRLYLINDRRK